MMTGCLVLAAFIWVLLHDLERPIETRQSDDIREGGKPFFYA